MSDDKNQGRWRATVVKAGNKAIPNTYDEQLKLVLKMKDVFRFRHFLAASGRALPPEMLLDIRKMETLMHQIILSMPDLSDMHAESRYWLEQNTVLQDQSLNEAAKRKPGVQGDVDKVPPLPVGRRIIELRTKSNQN